MKSFATLLIVLSCLSLYSQNLDGSWKLIEENGNKLHDEEIVRIYQDDYFAEAAKKTGSGEFLWTRGGNYTTAAYSETVDFNSTNPELVGKTSNAELRFLENNRMEISKIGSVQIWERISANKNDLDGNWVITGRERDGEMNSMRPGDRRTIKILGGDRFQWVAFNSATGEFHGTGGGTYSAKNGKYTENIDFFSRDNSRVGASLSFDYVLEDGEWHHSGKSSKGNAIHEIWSPYARAYSR